MIARSRGVDGHERSLGAVDALRVTRLRALEGVPRVALRAASSRDALGALLRPQTGVDRPDAADWAPAGERAAHEPRAFSSVEHVAGDPDPVRRHGERCAFAPDQGEHGAVNARALRRRGAAHA